MRKRQRHRQAERAGPPEELRHEPAEVGRAVAHAPVAGDRLRLSADGDDVDRAEHEEHHDPRRGADAGDGDRHDQDPLRDRLGQRQRVGDPERRQPLDTLRECRPTPREPLAQREGSAYKARAIRCLARERGGRRRARRVRVRHEAAARVAVNRYFERQDAGRPRRAPRRPRARGGSHCEAKRSSPGWSASPAGRGPRPTRRGTRARGRDAAAADVAVRDIRRRATMRAVCACGWRTRPRGRGGREAASEDLVAREQRRSRSTAPLAERHRAGVTSTGLGPVGGPPGQRASDTDR